MNLFFSIYNLQTTFAQCIRYFDFLKHSGSASTILLFKRAAGGGDFGTNYHQYFKWHSGIDGGGKLPPNIIPWPDYTNIYVGVSHSNFGSSVAISPDEKWLFSASNAFKCVFVFTHNSNDVWSTTPVTILQPTARAPEMTHSGTFGSQVACNNNFAVVSSDAGHSTYMLYIYKKTPAGSWANSHELILLEPAPTNHASFGTTLVMTSSFLFVACSSGSVVDGGQRVLIYKILNSSPWFNQVPDEEFNNPTMVMPRPAGLASHYVSCPAGAIQRDHGNFWKTTITCEDSFSDGMYATNDILVVGAPVTGGSGAVYNKAFVYVRDINDNWVRKEFIDLLHI